MRKFQFDYKSCFLLFTLLQPIIDITVLQFNIIPSLIRGLFLILTVIYLLKKKKTRIYLILLSSYVFLHIFIITLLKIPHDLSNEVLYIVKTIYFPILLLMFSDLPKGKDLMNIALINMLIIQFVMLTAAITDSTKSTYDMLAKKGHTGWFFSGNELSVILLIGLSFIILSIMLSMSHRQLILRSVMLVTHVTVMLTVGTKVSLFSIFIILIIAIACEIFIEKKRKGAIFFVLFLIGILFIYPYTPVSNNSQWMDSESYSNHTNQNQDYTTVNQMLSGRSDFLIQSTNQFREAGFLFKAFGMGYGGLYQESPKLVEMDGFDWLFGFGVFGVLILTYPLIMTFIELFVYLQRKINTKSVILTATVLLTLGAALTAGHVLSSPAVSIYLVITLALLREHLIPENELRVLVISTMYPSQKNPSFGIFIKNQVELLRKNNIKVDVISIKSLKMGKIKVIPKYTIWSIKNFLALLYKGKHYHVIHAHYIFPSGWYGKWYKKLFKTKFLVTVHGGDVDKMPKKHRWIRNESESILANADHVIAVGEMLRKSLKESFNVNCKKITVLNMGVNRYVFKPGHKNAARNELGLNQNKKIILFVGNLIKTKGLDELVSALNGLTLDMDFECHLIGANKEPQFLEETLSKARSSTYVHKAINQEQIARWLVASDVFVLPSHIEGFGLAALEAMACRTPVVGTRVGGLAYLLAGGSGLVVPAKDTKALKMAIERVLTDTNIRRYLVKMGDRKAEKFDQEKLITKLIHLYHNKEP